MAKSKKKKPNVKVTGPIVDAEFERKTESKDCQKEAEQAKGEEKMTNEERIEKNEKEMNELKEEIKGLKDLIQNTLGGNTTNEQKDQAKETNGTDKKAEPSEKQEPEAKGITGWVKKHPKLAVGSAIALAIGGAAIGAKCFADSKDDELAPSDSPVDTGEF